MEFPQVLKTPRLLLTRLEPGDFEDFLRASGAHDARALHTDEAAMRFRAHVEHWQRHGYGWWAVRDPQTRRFVGCGGLESATIDGKRATTASCDAWDRAYAGELVRIAVAQGFVGLDVQEILAAPPVSDAASRVLERAGFTRAEGPQAAYRLTAQAWCASPRLRGRAASRAFQAA